MQQTSVLYDGRADATPSQTMAHIQHSARLDRIAALAQPDRPLACMSATQRSLLVLDIPKKEIFPETMPIYLPYLLFPDSMLWCHDLVKSAFVDRPTSETAARYPRIDEIQRACAEFYGVRRADILSARRTAHIVRPRQVGYYLCRMLTLKSLPEIGRRFGGRDHTSALSGIKKIERLRKSDATLDASLHAIASMVGGSLA